VKPATKVILTFVGAGVASYLLAGDWASEKTAGFPMAAAGGEGVVAAGGAYWALKKRSRVGAVVGGVAAGLLVSQAKAILAQPVSPAVAAAVQVPSSGFTIQPRHPAEIPQATPYHGFTVSLSAPEPKPELLR